MDLKQKAHMPIYSVAPAPKKKASTMKTQTPTQRKQKTKR